MGKWGDDLVRKTAHAAQRARRAQAAGIAKIGRELIDAFNRDKTDPSVMAVCGHDTMTGYEFSIERGGVAYTVTVTRDLDT